MISLSLSLRNGFLPVANVQMNWHAFNNAKNQYNTNAARHSSATNIVGRIHRNIRNYSYIYIVSIVNTCAYFSHSCHNTNQCQVDRSVPFQKRIHLDDIESRRVWWPPHENKCRGFFSVSFFFLTLSVVCYLCTLSSMLKQIQCLLAAVSCAVVDCWSITSSHLSRSRIYTDGIEFHPYDLPLRLSRQREIIRAMQRSREVCVHHTTKVTHVSSALHLTRAFCLPPARNCYIAKLYI